MMNTADMIREELRAGHLVRGSMVLPSGGNMEFTALGVLDDGRIRVRVTHLHFTRTAVQVGEELGIPANRIHGWTSYPVVPTWMVGMI